MSLQNSATSPNHTSPHNNAPIEEMKKAFILMKVNHGNESYVWFIYTVEMIYIYIFIFQFNFGFHETSICKIINKVPPENIIKVYFFKK